MASPMVEGPGRSRYVIAGAMLAAALAVAAIVGVIVMRALIGYDITSFDAGAEAEVSIGDRGVALWSASPIDPGSCTADLLTGNGSDIETSSTTLTVTDADREWQRVGTLHAEPGSTYAVRCSGSDDGSPFGFAPAPRIAHYVILAAVGGGFSVLLVLASFTLWLVTLLQRQKARRPAQPWPQPPVMP